MENKRMKCIFMLVLLLLLCTGCGTQAQSATNNQKMEDASEEELTVNFGDSEINLNKDGSVLDSVSGNNDTSVRMEYANYEPEHECAILKEKSVYDCDIEADREAFDGNVDIVVGDKFYATQINDWFISFDEYEGKTVEIEGYYIGDFAPYDFVGRYGPVCQYCQGGYVSFEILSAEDLSQYQSLTDWIRVTGILRQGMDRENGPFYYIEALSVEKMPEIGLETVTN